MNQVRGYIFSRPFMGERVPQHVQNLVIREYCERNRLHFLLSATEYAMLGSHLILEQVIDELDKIEGFVAYSLFQLPHKSEFRQKIYTEIVAKKKTMHFAVEGMSASTMQECERIETLWQVRLTLPHCAQISA